MAFTLVALTPEGEVPLEDYRFDDDRGSDAARVAKEMSQWYGHKVQPRRLKDLADWRERERKRIAEGFYRQCASGAAPLPDWSDRGAGPIADHFALLWNNPHGSPQVSFYECDEHGLFDRRTTINVGRYVARYFGHLDENVRKRLIAEVDPPAEVLFATTRAEILKVYREGPDSCMSMGRRAEWEGLPCHPVEVYAGGDLAVAHLRNASGRVSARTVCWPAKKQYGRVYGDVDRLEGALRERGYRQVVRFDGARLLKIPAKRGWRMFEDEPYLPEQGFVLPYLDNIEGVAEDGEHLRAVVIRESTREPLHFDGGVHGVSRPAHWCPGLQNYSFRPFVYVRGAETAWSEQTLEHGLAFRCDGTGEVWSRAGSHRVLLSDGRQWSRRHFETHGFTCTRSGNRCANDDLVVIDGQKVSKTWKDREDRRQRQEREWSERDREIARIRSRQWMGADVIVDDPFRYTYIEPQITINMNNDGNVWRHIGQMLELPRSYLQQFENEAVPARDRAVHADRDTPPNPNARPWHSLIENAAIRSPRHNIRRR